jgi:hypothetical protein
MSISRPRMTASLVAAFVLLAGLIAGISAVTATPASAASCPTPYFPIQIHNGSDYLDDYGGGSGTYVHTYPHTGSANQSWCPQYADQGGTYFHPLNNQGLCLDAHTDNSGQQIWVYSCNGSASQRWCWDGSSTSKATYFTRRTSPGEALKDNGTYAIVTIVHGGASTWAPASGAIDNGC